jgi:hypothetical protein
LLFKNKAKDGAMSSKETKEYNRRETIVGGQHGEREDNNGTRRTIGRAKAG